MILRAVILPLAQVFGLPWQEVLAFLGVIGAAFAGLSYHATTWLDRRYVRKSAYYADRRERAEKFEATIEEMDQAIRAFATKGDERHAALMLELGKLQGRNDAAGGSKWPWPQHKPE